ncbi:MAG: Smr/MutS family protein [Rhodospirillales bacterium]
MPESPENKRKKKKKPARPGPEEDWALWRSVTETITPLPGKEAAPELPAAPDISEPAEKPPARARKPVEIPGESKPAAVLPALEAGALAGMDKRTAQRLRRGHLRPEAVLDLHRLTQAEAHDALIRFVGDAVGANRRTVLVITGKGLKPTGEVGVLRTRVPQWLNMAPLRHQVVAFCEAAPKDGGAGALYLRLKKFR